jgi:hypothetical protein
MLTSRTKAILFHLWIFAAHPAFALGFGEIQVRSSLGDPLLAGIEILEAPEGLDVGCFKLQRQTDGGLNEAFRGYVTLNRQPGSVTLIIKTLQPINDPILQFAIKSECDSLQRDYVVLLDPPLSGNQTTAVNGVLQAGDVLGHSKKKSGQSLKRRSVIHHGARTSNRRGKPGDFDQSKISNKVGASESVSHTSTPVGISDDNQRTKPRLTLSSGEPSTSNVENSKFALRLDTGLLNISRVGGSPSEAGGEATELSDDSTALSHRLANLETQLLALQKRNAELEILNKVSKTASTLAISREAFGRWWPFMLGILLLAGVTASGWLKYRKNRLLKDENIPWPVAEISAGDKKASASSASSAVEAEDVMHFESPLVNYHQQKESGGTEVREDILDQAEVFVAHGRSNFAIQVLQDHLQEAPQESPEPWLLLLDLLRRDGLTNEYMKASEACQRYFNIKVAAYTEVPSPENASGSIEDYPHVMEQLQEFWGKPELESYLNDLIYNRRIETRQGFEGGAYRDLLFLLAMVNPNA